MGLVESVFTNKPLGLYHVASIWIVIGKLSFESFTLFLPSFPQARWLPK